MIGAVRPYEFARLLPEHGIEPWVLTVTPEHVERHDPSMRIGVPAERIARTALAPSRLDRAVKLAQTCRRIAPGRTPAPALEEKRGTGPKTEPRSTPAPGGSSMAGRMREWLAFPDSRIGWYQPAVRAAESLLAKQEFDAILSTSPPRTAHLIARHLAGKYKLPWIMDLRDPWMSWTSPEARRSGVAAKQQQLFRSCLLQASAIVANTERLRSFVVGEHGDVAERVFAIPNGCLPPARQEDAPPSAPGRFSIGHYGDLYGKRTGRMFLQGVREWIDVARPDKGRLAIRFAGNEFDAATLAEAARPELQSTISFQAAVPRTEVRRMMAEDYVLLLVANEQPLQVPGKAYEYLAAGRRILAVTEHDGATADLLRGRPGCVIAETAEEAKCGIERFWEEFERGETAEVDHTGFLKENAFPRRAEQLAALIEICVKKPGPA